MYFLRLQFKVPMTHLGTAFSNNTSRMSSLVPSKSMIRGLIGAALGESFSTTQQYKFHYSFQWTTEYKTMMLALNHTVHTSKPDFRTLALSERVERYTIDYVEHLYNPNGMRLEGYIYIGMDDESELDKISKALKAPEYPLYLGKSSAFLRVVDVSIFKAKIKYENATFTNFFIGTSDVFQLTERLSDCMLGYRIADTFESVYTQPYPIYGSSKYGYIVDEERATNLSLW